MIQITEGDENSTLKIRSVALDAPLDHSFIGLGFYWNSGHHRPSC